MRAGDEKKKRRRGKRRKKVVGEGRRKGSEWG